MVGDRGAYSRSTTTCQARGQRNRPGVSELSTMPAEDLFSPGHRSVSAVCAQLHRAYHDLRFYPPGHPSATQTLETLSGMLVSHVDEHGTLVLEVEEDRLLYEGERVYSYDASRDNLAFLMFRDGIRLLSLHPGLEETEVEALTVVPGPRGRLGRRRARPGDEVLGAGFRARRLPRGRPVPRRRGAAGGDGRRAQGDRASQAGRSRPVGRPGHRRANRGIWRRWNRRPSICGASV